MKLTDDDLKALYRGTTEPAARDACPNGEELLGAALGELPDAERERVAGHVAACSACADEYRLLLELRPAIARAAGAEPATNVVPMHRGPSRQAFAVAAVLVLLAGATATIWRASRPHPEPLPAERSGRSATLETVPPHRARLDAPPATLSWSPVPSVETYRVRLYDFESTPIWESPPVAGTSVDLPESVRAALPRGKPVYWRVVAASGIERSELGPFQFSVAGGSAP